MLRNTPPSSQQLSFAILKHCANKGLLAPSFHKVLSILYGWYDRYGYFYNQDQAKLAKLSGLSLRSVKYALHIFRTKRIIKTRKALCRVTIKKDGTKHFEKKSAPLMLFRQSLQAIKRHTTKPTCPFNIILSKCERSDPQRPGPRPHEVEADGTFRAATRRGSFRSLLYRLKIFHQKTEPDDSVDNFIDC